MKKLFTLIAAALMAVGASAADGDATSTVFNVSQYSTLDGIDLKNCTTLYKYDETAKAVILTAYGAYQSSVKSWNDETKKGLGWVTYNAAGSSNVSGGWDATGVFQGSAYYGLLSSGSASDRAAAINSSRAYTFTVTGCDAVSILGKSGKKTEREVILTVKESGSDAIFAEQKDATNEIVTLTVGSMDASKTYEVTVTGNTSDNGHFYEIAFYIAASDDSGDNAGGTETELTLTEGHTLLIETLEAAGAADTDIVRFYVSDTSGAGRNGWGIGGFANSDNWSPIVEWTGKEGESWTYEYTVAQIKEVAGTTPGEYHGIGITINIYNDCKVDKVTLVKSGDNPGGDAGETEAELTLTEGHTLLIETLEAAGATDDDIVRFYVSDTSGAGRNGWGIGGFANSDNWSPIVEWTGKEGESWTYEYTVARIKEVAGTTPGEYHGIGITINIYNDCKVDKVTLVKSGSTGIQQTIAPAKVIENNVIYNLAGQKVNENYKGIVIKNGKKFIQK